SLFSGGSDPIGRTRRGCDRRLHSAGDLEKGLGRLRLRLLNHDRNTLVTPRADPRLDRDLAQEAHTLTVRLLARTAVAEDLVPAGAVRAAEIAHVLHDPEDRY